MRLKTKINERTRPPFAAASPGEAGVAFTLLLAGVTGLAPFALQSIAPGLPLLASAIAIPTESAQLLVSLAVLSMAAGAVVYGPAADRFGRRPVLLWGLGLAAVGAAISAMAESFALVLAGRILQSLGAGAGMVLSRAVARDLFEREEAAALIARVTAIMVVAPMLAPTIGGAIIESVGWRGVFWAIAGLAGALWLWTWAAFPETVRVRAPSFDLKSVFGDYRKIARLRVFWRYAGYGAISLSSFFLFVGGAPHVMERSFGVGPAAYGAYFLGIAGAYMAANAVNPWVTRRLGGDRSILLGSWIGLLGAGAAAVVLAMGVSAPWIVVAAAGANSIGAGLAVPNALAGAVGAAPERAGSASGLTSVVQFACAALAAQAAAALPADAPAAVPLGMALAAAASLVVFSVAAPRSTPSNGRIDV